MAMKECRGQMKSLKSLASDSHLKLVDPSVSGCPIEPAVGCHPVLPFHEFVGLSQGDSFDCFYRALAIGMVVHQGPEFTRWTSHWQQAEINELFDGRKATNIVASIKKEMVLPLIQGTIEYAYPLRRHVWRMPPLRRPSRAAAAARDRPDRPLTRRGPPGTDAGSLRRVADLRGTTAGPPAGTRRTRNRTTRASTRATTRASRSGARAGPSRPARSR